MNWKVHGLPSDEAKSSPAIRIVPWVTVTCSWPMPSRLARHYGISLAYAVILSSWIDPRLKQLTDCPDLLHGPCHEPPKPRNSGLRKGSGCNWTITDQSGQLSGKPFDIEPQYWNYSIHLKDFWGITDSFYKTDRLDARKKVQLTDDKITIGSSAKAEELRMARREFVSSIKDWQSTDRALYDDDGNCGCLPRICTNAPGKTPVILQKILNNMGVISRHRQEQGYAGRYSYRFIWNQPIPDLE